MGDTFCYDNGRFTNNQYAKGQTSYRSSKSDRWSISGQKRVKKTGNCRFYFPKHNRENVASAISAVVITPNIFPIASDARRTCSANIS